MTGAALEDLLSSLDIAVFERLGPGHFDVVGGRPQWLVELWPECAAEGPMAPGDRFPFLDAFLYDAEEHWAHHDAGRIKSGPWIETDGAGRDVYLEATASVVGGRKLLLVEFPKIAYEEHVATVQTGRETSLERDRMAREIQKKEILLHCIVHDLKGPLSGIAGAVSLLASKETLPGQKDLLEVALRQSNRLDLLIQGILHAFSAEIESLQSFEFDPATAPDAVSCSAEAALAMAPAFKVAKVQLDLDTGEAEAMSVVAEKVRLERVLQNLLGNALRYSPKRSTVRIVVAPEDEWITLAVEDEGPGVPDEQRERLFEKFSQGRTKSGSAGLGLYFCRITVERWGGSIGYEPRPEGGSRFWFRLRRV
jgi:signal transduction histidine kinase